MHYQNQQAQRPNFVQPHMPTRPPTQPNMQTRQPRPTVSMQQQNAQYGNQYAVQPGMTTMFLAQQGMQPSMTGTRVITVPGSSQQMAQVQFPQYTINTTSPPQFQVTANPAMYYPSMMPPQGQVYYTGQQAPPGAPMQTASQTRTPLNQMSNHSYMPTTPAAPMGAQSQSYPKREKRILKIINPETKQEVNIGGDAETGSGGGSGGSSARGTPAPLGSTPPPAPVQQPQQQMVGSTGAPPTRPVHPQQQAINQMNPQFMPQSMQQPPPSMVHQPPAPAHQGPTPASGQMNSQAHIPPQQEIHAQRTASQIQAEFAKQVAEVANKPTVVTKAPTQEPAASLNQQPQHIPAQSQNVPPVSQPINSVPITQTKTVTQSAPPRMGAPGSYQPPSQQAPGSYAGTSVPPPMVQAPVPSPAANIQAPPTNNANYASVAPVSQPPVLPTTVTQQQAPQSVTADAKIQPKQDESTIKEITPPQAPTEPFVSEKRSEPLKEEVKSAPVSLPQGELKDMKQIAPKKAQESERVSSELGKLDSTKEHSEVKDEKKSTEQKTSSVQASMPSETQVKSTPSVIKPSETSSVSEDSAKQVDMKSPEPQAVDLRTTIRTPGGTKHPLDLRTVERTPGGTAHTKKVPFGGSDSLKKQLMSLPAELMAGSDEASEPSQDVEDQPSNEVEGKPTETVTAPKVEEKKESSLDKATEKKAESTPIKTEDEPVKEDDRKKKPPRQRLKEEEKKEETTAPEKERPVINKQFDFTPQYFKEPAPVAPVKSTPPPTSVANDVDTTPQRPDEKPASRTTNEDSVARRNEINDAKSSSAKTPASTAVTGDETTQTSVINSAPKPSLQYDYKEDQWSPLNLEGKKAYDRNFLLQLQYAPESVTKPDGLPHLPEVVLESISSNSSRSSQGSYGATPDFTPGFVVRSGGSGPKNMTPKRNSQTRGGRPSQQKVITIPSISKENVELKRSSNAYKAFSKTDKANDDEEVVVRQFLSILNKLTPQKFQTLIGQILALPIKTEEVLKRIIDTIFEKAILEPSFSVAYANACAILSKHLVIEKENKERVSFKKLLLNRCQQEFQRDKTDTSEFEAKQKEIDAAPEEKKKELQEDLEFAKIKAKKRSLGNIRFIGELFKLQMLTEKIMHECVFTLVKSTDEESLECLCRLLFTIGKLLDVEKSKSRMDQYFQRIDTIINKKQTSSRVRFMLHDVIDLRKNNWVPRRDESAPKTIEQIHKDAQEEKIEKQLNAQRLAQEQRMNPTPRRDRQDRGPSRNVDGDGWTSIPAKANTLDPGKMKISKPVTDDNIQLGPGGRGFGGWGRGSTGGGGRNTSQEAEPRQKNLNRFQLLTMSNEDSKGRDDRRTPMGPPQGMPPRRSDSRDKRMGPGTPRTLPNRQSKERDRGERESAMAAARQLSGGSGMGGRLTPGGGSSRNQSRESSRNRESAAPPSAASAPPASLSPEQLDRKTKAIVDEYLQIEDLKEAVECVKELPSSSLSQFVDISINHVLERNAKARQKTGALLHELVKQGTLHLEQYLTGLKSILEFAEDMEIDIPKIWQYFGELIGPMVKDGDLELSFLKSVCEPIKTSGKAGKLVSEILHDAARSYGHVKVGELWRNSSLKWTDFLTPTQDLKEFIKDNKLEFTLGNEEPVSPGGKGLSPVEVQLELNSLLEKNKDNEIVFDWIDTNVGVDNTKKHFFIRALAEAVCKSTIEGTKVDEPLLKKRCVLLQRYLDHNGEFELQTLYALQKLVTDLQHPSGVLRRLFDVLYDEDIISEDAFNQWEKSTDPAESAGKGVALQSVNQFFKWLHETEEEEEQ